MNADDGKRTTIDAALRELLREVVREEVRAALAEQHAVHPRPDAEQQELLTVEEAGRLARVDPATIRTWIRRGLVGTYRAGRVYRVKRIELETFLARPAQPAPTTDLRQRARDFLARRDRK